MNNVEHNQTTAPQPENVASATEDAERRVRCTRPECDQFNRRGTHVVRGLDAPIHWTTTGSRRKVDDVGRASTVWRVGMRAVGDAPWRPTLDMGGALHDLGEHDDALEMSQALSQALVWGLHADLATARHSTQMLGDLIQGKAACSESS